MNCISKKNNNNNINSINLFQLVERFLKRVKSVGKNSNQRFYYIQLRVYENLIFAYCRRNLQEDTNLYYKKFRKVNDLRNKRMSISLNRMVIYKYKRMIRIDYCMQEYDTALDCIKKISEIVETHISVLEKKNKKL